MCALCACVHCVHVCIVCIVHCVHVCMCACVHCALCACVHCVHVCIVCMCACVCVYPTSGVSVGKPQIISVAMVIPGTLQCEESVHTYIYEQLVLAYDIKHSTNMASGAMLVALWTRKHSVYGKQLYKHSSCNVPYRDQLSHKDTIHTGTLNISLTSRGRLTTSRGPASLILAQLSVTCGTENWAARTWL